MNKSKTIKKLSRVLFLIIIYHLITWYITAADILSANEVRKFLNDNVWNADFFKSIRTAIEYLTTSTISVIYPFTGWPAFAAWIIVKITERKLCTFKVPKAKKSRKFLHALDSIKKFLDDVSFEGYAKYGMYVHVVLNHRLNTDFDRLYNITKSGVVHLGREFMEEQQLAKFLGKDYDNQLMLKKNQRQLIIELDGDKLVVNKGVTKALYLKEDGEITFDKVGEKTVLGNITLI